MPGQRIAYVRVSSIDPNPERQLEQLPLDQVFTDQASGRDTERPELERLLAFVRKTDTVVVHSMDRLARNLDDLRRIVGTLTGRGVRIEFVKENLTFTGEDSPMEDLMLSVMGAFAEFERALLRERQREGIALAKQRGAYRGRKKTLAPAQAAQLRQRVPVGKGKTRLAREFGISRQTLYKYLRTEDCRCLTAACGHPLRGLFGIRVLGRKDGAGLLGEEFLLFGRKPDISADPLGEIPGGDLGDAHLLTPKSDGNGSSNLNRLLALPDGYRWRERRKPLEELAFVFCNDGARLPGEFFPAGARKPDISADPVLPMDAEGSGDEHLLPTDHHRDANTGGCARPFHERNRPLASSDGYSRFHPSAVG